MFNNQRWFAELKNGSILDCGFGLVEEEFNGDTFTKLTDDVYYVFDKNTDIIDINGKRIGILEDLNYNESSVDNSFYLIPKIDVIRKFYKIIKRD
jgi:hypothetical protein